LPHWTVPEKNKDSKLLEQRSYLLYF